MSTVAIDLKIDHVVIPGICEPQSCGLEAACVQYKKTHYYCQCPIDGAPATKDFKCLGIRTVPVTPKPIYNVLRTLEYANPTPVATKRPVCNIKQLITTVSAQSKANHLPRILNVFGAQVFNSQVSDYFPEATAGSETTVSSGNVAHGTGAILVACAIGGALLLVIILALSVICYLRRRICIIAGKGQPRVRPGEPLLAERYITNPQYGVCGTGTAAAPAAAPASPNLLSSEVTNDQVPLLDSNALTFLEEIGEGCFGKVHKGLLRLEDDEQVVAIKVLKESAGRSAEEDFVREVSIMSAFRHPNILSLIGVVHREEINASPWMVFEYMEWGDLAGVLRGCRGGGRAGPALDEPALLH
ncbi:hypothetical protein MSG28_002114, partial [Choristoneura fumiferana]